MHIITYIVYITIASIMIIYVGNTCYKNGKVYITYYFSKDENFANSINNILRIAYYFLNLGLVIWTLNTLKKINSYQLLIEEITSRLSFIITIIAVLHLFNLITIYISHKHFKNESL